MEKSKNSNFIINVPLILISFLVLEELMLILGLAHVPISDYAPLIGIIIIALSLAFALYIKSSTITEDRKKIFATLLSTILIATLVLTGDFINLSH